MRCSPAVRAHRLGRDHPGEEVEEAPGACRGHDGLEVHLPAHAVAVSAHGTGLDHTASRRGASQAGTPLAR
eukprot:3297837-Rhodomonas_salina.1